LSPEGFAKMYPMAATKLKPLAMQLGAELPDDPAQAQEMIRSMVGYQPAKPERATLAKGTRMVERAPGGDWQTVAEGMEEPEKAQSLDLQLAQAHATGDQAKVDQILALKGREAAATRAPKGPQAELALSPEGVVLSSFGPSQKNEARRQAMERGLPVFENATTQKMGVTLAGIVQEAQELNDLMQDENVKAAIGPFAGRWTQLQGSFVDLPPNVQRAVQLMTSLSDTELRKRTGAAATKPEMQRILKFSTDPNKPIGHNMTAIQGLLKAGSRDYKALSGVGLLDEAVAAGGAAMDEDALMKKYGY